MLFVFVYSLFAAMVGLCAVGRKPGFVITFLLSWLITPFLMLLILYITRERVRTESY
jgi:hypothetical protein